MASIPVRHFSWPASGDEGGLMASLISLLRRKHKQNRWMLLAAAFEFACLGKILGVVIECDWTGLNPDCRYTHV
jgi:hypothetical protein